MAFSVFYFFKITNLDETKRRSSSLSLSLAKNFQWDFMRIFELINVTENKEELCMRQKNIPVVRQMKFQSPTLIPTSNYFISHGTDIIVPYTGRQ